MRMTGHARLSASAPLRGRRGRPAPGRRGRGARGSRAARRATTTASRARRRLEDVVAGAPSSRSFSDQRMRLSSSTTRIVRVAAKPPSVLRAGKFRGFAGFRCCPTTPRRTSGATQRRCYDACSHEAQRRSSRILGLALAVARRPGDLPRRRPDRRRPRAARSSTWRSSSSGFWTPRPGAAARRSPGSCDGSSPSRVRSGSTLAATPPLWVVVVEPRARARRGLDRGVPRRTGRRPRMLALERLVRELGDLKFALDQAAIVARTDQRGHHQLRQRQVLRDLEVLARGAARPGPPHPQLRLPPEGVHSRASGGRSRSGRVWRGEIRNRAKDGVASTGWTRRSCRSSNERRQAVPVPGDPRRHHGAQAAGGGAAASRRRSPRSARWRRSSRAREAKRHIMPGSIAASALCRNSLQPIRARVVRLS